MVLWIGTMLLLVFIVGAADITPGDPVRPAHIGPRPPLRPTLPPRPVRLPERLEVDPRLLVGLHARQAHPDWEYTVTHGGSAQLDAGWELNPDVPRHGSARADGLPVAWYWRKRREEPR